MGGQNEARGLWGRGPTPMVHVRVASLHCAALVQAAAQEGNVEVGSSRAKAARSHCTPLIFRKTNRLRQATLDVQ